MRESLQIQEFQQILKNAPLNIVVVVVVVVVVGVFLVVKLSKHSS